MAQLTTHVLDTLAGKPAAGVLIRLFHEETLLTEAVTNADGRCEGPLLTDAVSGTYELRFSLGDYFRAHGVDSPFFNEVPIQFTLEAGESYHVPLIATPWMYSTYRGS